MTNQEEIKMFEELRKKLPQISEKEFHDFRKGIWNDILKIVDFNGEKAIEVLKLLVWEPQILERFSMLKSSMGTILTCVNSIRQHLEVRKKMNYDWETDIKLNLEFIETEAESWIRKMKLEEGRNE